MHSLHKTFTQVQTSRLHPISCPVNMMDTIKLTRNGQEQRLHSPWLVHAVWKAKFLPFRSIKETEKNDSFPYKIKFYFTHEHQKWYSPLVKIPLLVFIRWNKIRSYTEKIKYLLYLLMSWMLERILTELHFIDSLHCSSWMKICCKSYAQKGIFDKMSRKLYIHLSKLCNSSGNYHYRSLRESIERHIRADFVSTDNNFKGIFLGISSGKDK